MANNNFAANVILIIHVLLILFIVLTPVLTNHKMTLLLHLVACIGILMHWVMNSDQCVLTLIEQQLRGKTNRKETFMYNMLHPIFKISDGFASKASYAILLGAMIMSITRFVNSKSKI